MRSDLIPARLRALERTQAWLARQMKAAGEDTSQQVLSGILKGKLPCSWRRAQAIGKALDLDAAEVMEWCVRQYERAHARKAA